MKPSTDTLRQSLLNERHELNVAIAGRAPDNLTCAIKHRIIEIDDQLIRAEAISVLPTLQVNQTLEIRELNGLAVDYQVTSNADSWERLSGLLSPQSSLATRGRFVAVTNGLVAHRVQI